MTRGNADLHLECRRTQLLVNYHISPSIFHCFRSQLEVSMLTPTREAIDAAMTYGREKLGLASYNRSNRQQSVSSLLERIKLLIASAF